MNKHQLNCFNFIRTRHLQCFTYNTFHGFNIQPSCQPYVTQSEKDLSSVIQRRCSRVINVRTGRSEWSTLNQLEESSAHVWSAPAKNLKKQWPTATPWYAKTQTTCTCHDNIGQTSIVNVERFSKISATKNLSAHLQSIPFTCTISSALNMAIVHTLLQP